MTSRRRRTPRRTRDDGPPLSTEPYPAWPDPRLLLVLEVNDWDSFVAWCRIEGIPHPRQSDVLRFEEPVAT